MKVRSTIILISLTILASVLITGCANGKDSASTHINIDWVENKSPLLSYNGMLITGIYNNVSYSFREEDFKEDKAKKAISGLEKLLRVADKIYGPRSIDANVYFNIPNDKDNKCVKAMRIEDIDKITFDEIWNMLRYVYPDASFNGEEYGLLKWYYENKVLEPVEKKKRDEAIFDQDRQFERAQLKAFLMQDNGLIIVDFIIPSMDASFSNDEIASTTRRLIVDFSNWYIENTDFESYLDYVLQLNNMNEKSRIMPKKSWLRSLGVDKKYKETAKYAFKYTNSVVEPYCVEDDYSVWKFSQMDFRTTGYYRMIKAFGRIKKLAYSDFKEAKNILNVHIPNNLGKPEIKTKFNSAVNNLDADVRNDSICLYDLDSVECSLLREYCRYLIVGKGRLIDSDEKIMRDALPEYIAMHICENRLFNSVPPMQAAMWETKNHDLRLGFFGIIQEDDDYKKLDWIDAKIFFDSHRALTEEEKAIALEKERRCLENGTKEEETAIAGYLVEEYGINNFLDLCKVDSEHQFYERLGMDYDELYECTSRWVDEQVIGVDIEAYVGW